PRRGALKAGLMLALGAVLPIVSPAAAAEDFYKGKTLRVIVGYAAGGGYDIYGRVFAEYFGKYLPGHPTIVVQNMPGAGSFVAAKYLYNVAPQDGTYFGMVSQTLALDATMNEDTSKFDVTKMPYIGRLLDNVDVGAGKPGSRFKSFDDARKMEIVVGATGGASPGFLMPAALVKYAGAKFKIVSGYGGSADAALALERGEVDLIASVGLPYIAQRNPEWLKDQAAPILYSMGLKRHPLIPWVPTLGELGTTDEGKTVLRTIAASSEIGRSINMTPGVPAERLALLRKAFQDMVKDPEFIAELAKHEIPIYGATGEELDDITREVMKTPKPVLEKLKELTKQS
ncbi:MAG: extra-cytoplasmic solute receptor, partial [Hyphomicrobiales bacterium]|nr:extra-cytoplasmic solute receptor [Hyphomicrobiales bacterium]